MANINESPDKMNILSKKDFKLMRVIGIVFPHFYNWVPTTFGNTIYLPANWDMFKQSVKFIIIEHEKIHARQQLKCPPIIYHFLNTFIFPILICPFRLYWEKRAWEETIQLASDIYGADFLNDEGFLWFISQADLFYSSRGGWMWLNKKSINNWLNYMITSNLKRVSTESTT